MGFIEYRIGDIIEPAVEVTRIEEGGMGRVYFGTCRARQVPVIVKTLSRAIWVKYQMADKWPHIKAELIEARLPSRSIDVGEYLYFTFFREARLTCQSRNHPNVIRGLRFWWTENGQPFLECEFFEHSRDLSSLEQMVAQSSAAKRLAFLEAAHIAVSFCNAMIYVSKEMLALHNRSHPENRAVAFVHRDIKPNNILIDERNTIKLIDLGLAKYHLQKTTTVFLSQYFSGGNPTYSPPEQLTNYDAVMPSSDIYAFGVTIYVLLGASPGRILEEGGARRIPGIPDGLHRVLSTCLQQNMADRYPTFRRLKMAMMNWIAEVRNGTVPISENRRCARCGYVSPDPEPSPFTAGQRVRGPRRHEMVYVPAGSFHKGCREDHKALLTRKLGTARPYADEEYREAKIEAFEIDIYPVTNDQYYEFVHETRYNRTPSHWKQESPEPFSASHANVPVVNVSYDDALAYCAWAGLRLPTGDEWEKSARGSEGRLYPWGDEYDPKHCNSAESGHREPVAVDQYPDGASPYGCLQMCGNVFEWVDEPHPKSTDYHYLRGGSWAVSCAVLGAPFLHYIAAARSATAATNQHDIFGFRCARNVSTDGRSGTTSTSNPQSKEIEKQCPLCGGKFVTFDPREIKVPEKNIYTWAGYFDIE